MVTSFIGLATPSEFLRHVVNPDVREFCAPDQAELRLAYHACNSLFTLRDWVHETHKNTAWKYQSNEFGRLSSKGAFQEDLVKIEPNFGIVADIANASKHMILDISRRSTSLHGIANVHIQTTNVGALGDGALGEFALGEGPEIHRVLVKIDDSFFDVARCAAAVFKLWNDLFSENGW